MAGRRSTGWVRSARIGPRPRWVRQLRGSLWSFSFLLRDLPISPTTLLRDLSNLRKCQSELPHLAILVWLRRRLSLQLRVHFCPSPYITFSTIANVSPDTLNVFQFPERSSDLDDVDKAWAWGYMAEGNYDRASAIFAAMERQTPGAGWPKLGTGLMAGFSGDYRKAVYQFRRAFRFDRTSPGRLPTEKDMQEKGAAHVRLLQTRS